MNKTHIKYKGKEGLINMEKKKDKIKSHKIQRN